MNVEDELRAVLARRSAPAGFEQRLLGQLKRPRSYRVWVAAAAVATLALTGVFEHQRRQRLEAVVAGEQLAHAMDIVNAKLDAAKQKVMEIGDRQ
jgi:hypothetical protein